MPEFSQRIILKPPIYYLSTKNALQFKMQKKAGKRSRAEKRWIFSGNGEEKLAQGDAKHYKAREEK